MAFTLVASSGIQNGNGLSWTHTFTLNNAVLAQEVSDSTVTPSASDFKDSSGTPKTLNLDKSSGLFSLSSAAHFSLIVPSGFTSPLKGPVTNFFTWVAQEWSGNDTTTLLDVSNSTGATSASPTASPLTGPSINTGANAGLAIASTTLHNGSAAFGLTVTGTNFSDTFSTSHDGTQQNDSADDGGSFNWRTTSVASQTGLADSWSWTSGSMTDRAEVITSYNAAASGGIPPGLGPVTHIWEPNMDAAVAAMMR